MRTSAFKLAFKSHPVKASEDADTLKLPLNKFTFIPLKKERSFTKMNWKKCNYIYKTSRKRVWCGGGAKNNNSVQKVYSGRGLLWGDNGNKAAYFHEKQQTRHDVLFVWSFSFRSIVLFCTDFDKLNRQFKIYYESKHIPILINRYVKVLHAQLWSKRRDFILKCDINRKWSTPGAIGEDQQATAVKQAILKLSGEARPVTEGQLTQAMTQTCRRIRCVLTFLPKYWKHWTVIG